MSCKGWDEGKRDVPSAGQNSGRGSLCVLGLVVRGEFWEEVERKFPRPLLEEHVARVRIRENWGVALQTASLHWCWWGGWRYPRGGKGQQMTGTCSCLWFHIVTSGGRGLAPLSVIGQIY